MSATGREATPFWKRIIGVSLLKFFPNASGLRQIGITEDMETGFLGNAINLQGGTLLKRTPLHYLTQRHIISALNGAITVGVDVASTALVGSDTIPVCTLAAQRVAFDMVPDVPRTIEVDTDDAGIGDGTFASDTVTVEGFDQFGNAQVEEIPCNGLTAVEGILPFSRVTFVTIPPGPVGGEQVTVEGGSALAVPFPFLAAEFVEFGVKASAATAYTVTAPPTMAGYHYSGTLIDAITATATTFKIAGTAGIATTLNTDDPWMEIKSGRGYSELVKVSAASHSAGEITVTCVRGLALTTARAWKAGTKVVSKNPSTISPSITADDRYEVAIATEVL
jgi:hypothetical protein